MNVRGFCIILFLMVVVELNAQNPKIIEVSYDRTTILIFPADIPDAESVDAGVGVQAVISGGYRLKLASKKSTGFRNTSLYVELESGHYYLFELTFNNDPEQLIHEISVEEATGTIHRDLSAQNIRDSEHAEKEDHTSQDAPQDLVNNALTIIDRSPNVTGIGVKQRKFVTWIESIFIRDNKVYFEMALSNESNIDYEINFIKFTIQNKKSGANKVAQQSPEVEPVYVYNGDVSTVSKRSRITKVMVFDRLVLSEKQYLLVEVYEKRGARHMKFKIDSDEIINAKLLS
jgi:conjugative transposon TraN protein